MREEKEGSRLSVGFFVCFFLVAQRSVSKDGAGVARVASGQV